MAEASGEARRPERRPRPERGQASFRCVHCHREVDTSAFGTQHRNHCPHCLWSRHVDDARPGDRAATCQASMEPIAISVRKDGEWVLIHRCNGCGVLDSNRAAGDDNPLLLLRIAVRPLAMPPFPLDRILPEIDAP
jgi:DNA-directed RNA polymerase subunit RPC12/RpoP